MIILILIFNWCLGLLLFWTGEKIAIAQKSWKILLPVLLLAIIFALPGTLSLPQYSHFLDNSKWFYVYRTFFISDFLMGGMGLLFGIMGGLLCQKKLILHSAMIACFIMAVFIPFVKPVIAPVCKNNLLDKWTKDGVCLQTSDSTCGPASAATILRKFDISVTEKDIVAESFTSTGGTEIWYIARAFNRRGFTTEFIITESELIDVNNIPCPSIAGAEIGKNGHFISILEKTDIGYIIGDPLIGKREVSFSKIISDSGLNGFFLKISR